MKYLAFYLKQVYNWNPSPQHSKGLDTPIRYINSRVVLKRWTPKNVVVDTSASIERSDVTMTSHSSFAFGLLFTANDYTQNIIFQQLPQWHVRQPRYCGNHRQKKAYCFCVTVNCCCLVEFELLFVSCFFNCYLPWSSFYLYLTLWIECFPQWTFSDICESQSKWIRPIWFKVVGNSIVLINLNKTITVRFFAL